MDCKNLGIGLITLSITLFLGITVSEFLRFKGIPEIEVIELKNLNDFSEMNFKGENGFTTQNKSLNCEPKDKNLKYQTLPLHPNDESIYMEVEEDQNIILVPVPDAPEKSKNKISSNKSAKTAPPKLEKDFKENSSPLIINQDLLHKEICREKENGRK